MNEYRSHQGHRAHGFRAGGGRPTKACVECRRQKMKCEPSDGGPCRRCKNGKIECVFKPRANARQPTSPRPGNVLPISELSSSDVMVRLAVIESMLGIGRNGHHSSPVSSTARSPSHIIGTFMEEEEADPALSGLWPSVEVLRRYPVSASGDLWSKPVVSQLWLSFYANMEGLHFQSESENFKNPTPLLLVATLHVSALQHASVKLAALAPAYFQVTCSAIAALSIPESYVQSETLSVDCLASPPSVELKAFHNILGIILAGLVSEAFVPLTGTWISIGYRLMLDHCPVYVGESAGKWRQLFSGLQIIDQEHASLHLSCTIVPIQAPLPSLRQLQGFIDDPFSRLTAMMHSGLNHFAGRGLPTIWSVMSTSQPEAIAAPIFPFTDRDTHIIKEWARNLDDWLVSSNRPGDTGHTGVQIRRQYSLHRLFVLSIYHPARGFDLFASRVASSESHELLLSARATLLLRRDDHGIWANWDLVMITWAAILILQGAEGGLGEHEDILLVQDHLDKLRSIKRPAPSLHHMLADRLQTWLDNMNVSPTARLVQPQFDPTWSLFDQNSIQLASASLFQQGSLDSNLSLNNHDATSHALGATAPDAQQQVSYIDPSLWGMYGEPTASWPLNLTRFFGNTASHVTITSEHEH